MFGKYFARASVVDGYVDTRFSQISLRKLKFFAKSFWTFSFEAQVDFFLNQKQDKKSPDTVPLSDYCTPIMS